MKPLPYPTAEQVKSSIDLHKRIKAAFMQERCNFNEVQPQFYDLEAFDHFRPYFIIASDALWVENEEGLAFVVRFGNQRDSSILIEYIENEGGRDWIEIDHESFASPHRYLQNGEFRTFITHGGRNLDQERIEWEPEIQLEVGLTHLQSRDPVMRDAIDHLRRRVQQRIDQALQASSLHPFLNLQGEKE